MTGTGEEPVGMSRPGLTTSFLARRLCSFVLVFATWLTVRTLYDDTPHGSTASQ